MPVNNSGAKKRPPGHKAYIETYCKHLWVFSSSYKNSVNRELMWEENINCHMEELVLFSIFYPQPCLPVLLEVSEMSMGNRERNYEGHMPSLSGFQQPRVDTPSNIPGHLCGLKPIIQVPFLPADSTTNQLKAEPSFSYV